MKHVHQPMISTQAHSLGACSRLEIDLCECGAFRLPPGSKHGRG